MVAALLLAAGGVLSEQGGCYSAKDVWMCSIPAVWCWLLWDAAKARHRAHTGDTGAQQKAIFAYLGGRPSEDVGA